MFPLQLLQSLSRTLSKLWSLSSTLLLLSLFLDNRSLSLYGYLLPQLYLVCAYISIIALFFCLPPAIIIEGPKLMQSGFADAISKVGLAKFLSDLFWVGMFYHLYNQLATNTLERVAPLTHAVGNVLKRVFVIGFSIIVFGNRISTQTAIGTSIAIAGVAIYSYIKAQLEEEKRKAVPPGSAAS